MEFMKRCGYNGVDEELGVWSPLGFCTGVSGQV